MLSPGLGRFASADTVLDGLNRYSYVRGNPLRFIDPTGHKTIWCTTDPITLPPILGGPPIPITIPGIPYPCGSEPDDELQKQPGPNPTPTPGGTPNPELPQPGATATICPTPVPQ